MSPFSYLCVFQLDALSWKRVVSYKRLWKGEELNAKFHFFCSKFHEISWSYCLLKVSTCALFISNLCVFNLRFCHGKRGFLVKFQFLLISHSVLVKIS